MQTPPLTFPLRPLKSPKAKQHKSAQLLSLEKNENPTKTKSRFSGGYFRIQTSAASSAKKPSWSSLFQRLPTAPIGLALGWPIRKQHFAKDTGFCSFNRLVRELRVLTNEILLPELADPPSERARKAKKCPNARIADQYGLRRPYTPCLSPSSCCLWSAFHGFER
jgi:hypothetical protein